MSGHTPPDAVLLLGAGASIKSGIPGAADLVDLAGKWAWCRESGRAFEDHSVMPSDWRPWLHSQPWFDATRPLADLYPTAVEQLLNPRESRRQFFLTAMKAAATPSEGYRALSRLLAARTVMTVLTVNFDGLVAEACRADNHVPHITEVPGPDDFEEFSLSPVFPQVVQLHGSVERYRDCNLETEVQSLNSAFRDALLPLMRDHPLVVVGYRGAEPSVMVDLLLQGAKQPHGYRHGLYWCVRPEDADDLHPHVQQLAEALGGNFRLVTIGGFDQAMVQWAEGARPAPAPPWGAAHEPDVADLRPTDVSDDELNQHLIRERYAEYVSRLERDGSEAEGSDVWAQMRALRVARDADGQPRVTRAGQLLFGRGALTRVEVRSDDVFRPIAGNLFEVLDAVDEAIEDLNQPYRLKADVSEDVRRFDRRAIKELLVNALAHRDHDDERAVRVKVTAERFEVTSPGGLLPGVSEEVLGVRGVKAYRNPVIANVLYGAGAMDKAGSGLADVVKWTRQAGGEASFVVNTDDDLFTASMSAREVALDKTTRTADPGDLEHFTVNALVIHPPGQIYTGACRFGTPRAVFAAYPETSFPPFSLRRGRLSALAPFDGVLADLAEVTESRSLDEDLPLAVELLNRELLAWARDRGLRAHPPTMRLWFPRAEDGAREVSYRARVRDATRTVTKPKLAADGERVRHWIHEAVRCSFRRYGATWVLHLVPTVVFTHDGEGRLLKGPRVSPMATRALARDFNPQVHNDLYFWRWVLCGNEPEAQIGPITIGSHFPGRDAMDAPPAIGGLGTPDDNLAFGEADDDMLEVADHGVASP